MAWVGKVAGNAARCYDMSDSLGYGLAVSPTTPKNVWSPVQFSSIIAPTFSSTPWDPSTVTSYPTGDASNWWVSGSSTAANATLAFVVIHFDSLGTVMSIGPSYNVSTSSTYLVASTSAYPLFGPLVWDSFQAATSFGLIVVTVSAGTWNLQFNLL